MVLKQFVVDYLKIGCKSTNETALNQQILMVNVFGFIGYSITLLLGISALLRGDTILGSVLLVASGIFFSSHLILRYSHAKLSYKVASNLSIISLVILMLELVYTGGYRNTGPLWMYIVPPVILFFGGLYKGLRNLGIFVLIVSLILFYPDERLLLATYSYEFKSRLVYSFFTVSALFAFYEYARQLSYERLHALNKKFQQQARIDPLSGLQNRRGMLEKLTYEHERSKRSNHHISLMMLDIDHFKRVNDAFGHDTGDYIIQELARILSASVRKQDTVARWGGEEFLFLLPETIEQQAYILAEKIRNGIAATKFTHQQKILKLTVSIGIYEIMHGDSISKAISSSDSYLYEAKDRGRNRSVMSS
jgi:diguanylate cyclase (GGDEF)-like protein